MNESLSSMEENKIKIPPPIPTSSDGTNIHLSYIRRDIDEMRINEQKRHEEIIDIIETLRTSHVTNYDFTQHLKKDDDHEQRIRFLEKSVWKYFGFSAGIAAIISLFGNFLLNLLK